jgi:mRNA-degrading endonuclease RelE of RelBE toxin-antitoxin system
MGTKFYSVVIDKKVLKGLSKLPLKIQKKLNLLVKDLRDRGPTQPNWPNYSKLEKDNYHCHLDYSWVACWKNEKGTLIIEVYYAGSREKAPY